MPSNLFLERDGAGVDVVYFGAVALNYGLSFFLPQIVKAFGPSNARAGIVAALPQAVGLVSMVAWSRRSDRKMERRFHLAFPLLVASAGVAVSTLFDDPTMKMAPLAPGGIALINSIGNMAGVTARLRWAA